MAEQFQEEQITEAWDPVMESRLRYERLLKRMLTEADSKSQPAIEGSAEL